MRRIDNVRRREARAQCSGQAEPIHGEDLIEAFSNARCCIGPVALEPRGVLVKLAQALLSLELPGGAQGGPCLVVLRVRQVADDIPQLVVATALYLVAGAEHLGDRAA